MRCDRDRGSIYKIEIADRCDVIEIADRCDVIEIADRCDVIEIADRCDVIEIADRCDVIEIADRCDVIEIADRCDVIEIADRCDVIEIADRCDVIEIDRIDPRSRRLSFRSIDSRQIHCRTRCIDGFLVSRVRRCIGECPYKQRTSTRPRRGSIFDPSIA